jgi:DNA-binding IclR family transcriptional regulator
VTVAAQERVFLEPRELALLVALSHPGTRWHRAGDLSHRIGESRPRTLGTLYELADRQLVTHDDRRPRRWSITGLGEGALGRVADDGGAPR